MFLIPTHRPANCRARNVTRKVRFFSPDEVRRILAIAEEPWRTMFTILAMTGMRAAEVLGLQWADIDFERRVIRIERTAWYGRIQTPKSRKSEAVLPMPRVARKAAVRERMDKH